MQSLAATFMVAFSMAVPQHEPPQRFQHVPEGCSHHFTIRMARRAVDAAYGGLGGVSAHRARKIGWYIRCQWNTQHRPQLHRMLSAHRSRWRHRRDHPMHSTAVSWYDDAGQTASGVHATMGFAACGMGLCVPMGARVEFCYPAGSSHCIVGVRDDSGPYIPSRGYDLGQDLAGWLGIQQAGVAEVSWRLVR
jgi:hypothetical protein